MQQQVIISLTWRPNNFHNHERENARMIEKINGGKIQRCHIVANQRIFFFFAFFLKTFFFFANQMKNRDIKRQMLKNPKAYLRHRIIFQQ